MRIQNFYNKIVAGLITLICALGQPVVFALDAIAQQSHVMQYNVGISPAGMTTANLPQSQAIYFEKNFIKNLKAATVYPRCASPRDLPANHGNSMVLYMYNPMGADTVQAAEGVIGSSKIIRVVSNQTYIGQFADYINFSDLALQTAIDPTLNNVSKELAYSAGQTISIIVRNATEAASAVDSSTLIEMAANTPFTKNEVVQMVQSLAGRNVLPFEAGKFCGVVHPFVVGDTVQDVSNNSASDILKHTREGQMRLEELAGEDDEAQIMDWAGARFFQSTLVTQTTNYLGSGKTALRTYLYGEDGVIRITLGKNEGTEIGDGDYRNIKCWIRELTEPSVADQARMIGGFTSYNMKFAATIPPDTTQRVRMVDSVSLIS